VRAEIEREHNPSQPSASTDEISKKNLLLSFIIPGVCGIFLAV